MLVCVFLDAHCTRDRGCSAHPVFPAPSDFGRANEIANLGRSAPRECGVIFCIATTSTPSSLRTRLCEKSWTFLPDGHGGDFGDASSLSGACGGERLQERGHSENADHPFEIIV